MQTELTRPPRVPFNRPIRVVVIDGEPRRMRAGNLSRGGMYLQGKNPPAQGCRLTVALESHSGAIPLGQAEVVWASPEQGCGVRFTSVGPEAQVMLETFLKHGGTSSRRLDDLAAEAPTPVVLEAAWEELKK